MPLFNDRRNDESAEDIPTIPTSVGPRKDYGPSPFKGNAPSGYSPNRETAFNNPLSPHFTGKKTPIPGVKGGFNVEYKDWPTPKKQEPVNKYTTQNQHLDKIYTTRGKQFGVASDISKNVSTLNSKISKVGPDSPRYAQLIGAKARQVAGYMKKTDKPTPIPKGVPTRNMRDSDLDRSGDPSKYKAATQSGLGGLAKRDPGGFAPGKTGDKYVNAGVNPNLDTSHYNPYRKQAVAQAKTDAANQLRTRQFIMSYGDNPTRAKKTK